MNKRTIIFFDGQNLYHLGKTAFGGVTSGSQYFYPSYDVECLAKRITNSILGREISQIRFYTGVPEQNGEDNDSPLLTSHPQHAYHNGQR